MSGPRESIFTTSGIQGELYDHQPFEAEARLNNRLVRNSVRTAKKTQYFTITKIIRLMLFEKAIPVYSENHTKHINTKRRVTDC
jgi:hypothetical protein